MAPGVVESPEPENICPWPLDASCMVAHIGGGEDEEHVAGLEAVGGGEQSVVALVLMELAQEQDEPVPSADRFERPSGRCGGGVLGVQGPPPQAPCGGRPGRPPGPPRPAPALLWPPPALGTSH